MLQEKVPVGSTDFGPLMAKALANIANQDSATRNNAEQFIKTAMKEDGCLSQLLTLASTAQVSEASAFRAFFA